MCCWSKQKRKYYKMAKLWVIFTGISSSMLLYLFTILQREVIKTKYCTTRLHLLTSIQFLAISVCCNDKKMMKHGSWQYKLHSLELLLWHCMSVLKFALWCHVTCLPLHSSMGISVSNHGQLHNFFKKFYNYF